MVGKTVLDVKDISRADAYRINEIVNSAWDRYRENKYVLDRSKDKTIDLGYLKILEDYTGEYGKAVFVLLNLVDTETWPHLTALRNMVNSADWEYPVEMRDYITEYDKLLEERERVLSDLDRVAKRRIKPSDSENTKHAIRVYRAASKMKGMELDTLKRLRDLVENRGGLMNDI